jgi:hypothetical protein
MPLGDKYIGKNSWLAARCLGDELIIMSAKDSTLFTLNPCAAAIWDAADGVTPLSRLVENSICAEFDVGLQEALADAEQLVSDLAEHGILVISDQPIAAQQI